MHARLPHRRVRDRILLLLTLWPLVGATHAADPPSGLPGAGAAGGPGGVGVAAPLPEAPSPPSPRAALHELFAAHREWQFREAPEFAIRKGDYRFAGRLRDGSLAAIERRHGETQAFLDRLHALDRSALAPTDQLNYDLFAWLLTSDIERHRFRMFLAPLGARGGPHLEVAQLHEGLRLARYADYADYLQRLEDVPRLMADTITLLRLGLKEGRTPARVALAGVEAQFKALLDDHQIDALGGPLTSLPAALTDAEQAELRRRFEERSLPAVRTALAELRSFTRDEYLPNCRTSIAATALPDGPAYYAAALRYYTTTDLTPRAIHELGLREVARIRAEVRAVIRRTDFLALHPDAQTLDDDALFRAFTGYLRTDPRFYHATADDLVRGYRDLCKRIDAELPRLFTKLPRLTYGVRPVPAFAAPDAATGSFHPGDIRNAQAGTFYVNTFALEQRPKYEMVALALHEAVPGHHFQSQLARELEDVPAFRQDLWIEAFGEGWALYAERLGLELGLYDDPYDDFGRLMFELWRAARLVVDPGMHALGWSRDQAIAYLRENTGLSELNIVSEVDRYIEWPGQATCYKIGELRLRALRARAEAALGPHFDLRAFHDMLLDAGTLPLALTEQRVDAWIAGQQAAADAPGA